MTLIGNGYMPWLFWDGRKDSLWSQALGPVESPVEHGISRTYAFSLIVKHYGDEYEAVFGKLPEVSRLKGMIARPGTDDPEAFKMWIRAPLAERDAVNRVYSNFGKAVAAFVRTILPGEARFDRYAASVLEGRGREPANIFTGEEAEGLRLFIGKAGCVGCHNGPLFTNGGFHNVRIPPTEKLPFDAGRSEGIISVLGDEFNCLGPYSDATGRDCAELWYLDTDTKKYVGAMKTPTLRNIATHPPYMHAGQLATLEEVMEFYAGIADNPEITHNGLSRGDQDKIRAFLGTLTGKVRSMK
jgi:cytochrome c peroxidase